MKSLFPCFYGLIFLLWAPLLPAQTAHSEADFTRLIQQHLGGQIEVPVTDGRIDVQTEEYAIEVEFASKWKQAVGQALYYGMSTNLQPGIVLILRNNAQYSYFQQLNSALNYANLGHRVRVWAWPFDFQDSPGVRSGRVAPASFPPDTGYWLNLSSQKRHNSSCTANYGKTNGIPCGPDEGEACGICGG